MSRKAGDPEDADGWLDVTRSAAARLRTRPDRTAVLVVGLHGHRGHLIDERTDATQRLLRAAAGRLRSLVGRRGEVIVADETSVVGVVDAGEEAAVEIAHQARDAIESFPLTVAGVSASVRAGVGVSLASAGTASSALVAAARSAAVRAHQEPDRVTVVRTP